MNAEQLIEKQERQQLEFLPKRLHKAARMAQDADRIARATGSTTEVALMALAIDALVNELAGGISVIT